MTPSMTIWHFASWLYNYTKGLTLLTNNANFKLINTSVQTINPRWMREGILFHLTRINEHAYLSIQFDVPAQSAF